MNFDNISLYDGINGQNELLRAVVLMLLIEKDLETHIVFEKRSSNVSHASEISFPGGKIDKLDTSLEQTALRETYEELGIKPENIKILTRLNTVIFPLGVLIEAFFGKTSISFDALSINTSEVESVFTMPLSFFMETEPEIYGVHSALSSTITDINTNEKKILLPVDKLNLPDKYNKSWGSFVYNVFCYNTPYGLIWGITARIIYDTILKLRGLE